MTKQFGICMVNCDIIDEINCIKQLEITNLVQIVFLNDEQGKCSIKLMNDGGPLKFGKTIYWCESKNITILSNDLIPFLVDTDYWGRLDILRFKKKIVNLKVGSTGNLQVVYNNCKYFIKFSVLYIGPVSTLGEGFLVGIHLILDSGIYNIQSLVHQLLQQFNNKNEHTNSLLTIRVEHLFSEIQLADSLNVRTNSPITLDEPMDVDHYNSAGIELHSTVFQNYNKHRRGSTTHSEFIHNQEILKEIDIEKLGKNGTNPEFNHDKEINELGKHITKECLGCEKLQDLFTFPCSHAYCYKCLMDRLNKVKSEESVVCPNCGVILEFDEQQRLHDFIGIHVSELTKPENNNKYMSNDHSLLKNAEKKSWPWSNKEKKNASNDKGKNTTSVGNKIEAEFINNKEILKEMEIDKLGKNGTNLKFNHNKQINELGRHVTKECLGCEKLQDLFTFPCSHTLCCKCLMDRLDKANSSTSVICPICGVILEFDEQRRLQEFLNYHLSQLIKHETNNKYMPNDHSLQKNEEKKSWPWSNKEKKSASNDKGKNTTSSGNKIEALQCQTCKALNKYSALKCKSCSRPLNSKEYCYVPQ